MEVRKMNTRRCPSCGAEMELSLSDKALTCPFCHTHIDVDITEFGNTGMLDEKMFDFLWDFDSLKKYENVVTSIDSMRYCLNHLKSTDSVEEYIRTALISDNDVAAEGIHQERIDKVMPKIADLTGPGEHIIVYGDEGIFSRGKEFFVITDKRSIFVKGKKKNTVLHSEVSVIRMNPNGGYPRWRLNNREELYISGIGNKYRLQGAIAALICLYSWNSRNAKIKLM